MKRLLFLFLMMTFAYSIGSAQIELGAYLGLNNTTLSGDSPKKFKYKAKPGPTFGAILNIPIKEDILIRFEPGYAISRPVLQYADDSEGIYRDSLEMIMDYVKIPILLELRSDNMKWHFMAGIDFQLGIRQVVVDGDEETDLSSELNQFNPNIMFGLGRRIDIGKPILNVDLRFNQAILNLSANPDSETSLVPRIKTSAVELLVTIEFTTKKNK